MWAYELHVCAVRLLSVRTARGILSPSRPVRKHVLIAQESRLQPDAPIWNGLITLAGRAGQLQRAFQVKQKAFTSTYINLFPIKIR